MIQSKKIKLFLTAIIISVVMTLLPLQTEAKDKIYLNRTKITLNVGQTKKLSLIRNKKNVKKKIKKKIKWVSGNRKKVSVDRKGVIRALHSGKAKITAKYQGKKYACIVVVKNRRQSDAFTPTPLLYQPHFLRRSQSDFVPHPQLLSSPDPFYLSFHRSY